MNSRQKMNMVQLSWQRGSVSVEAKANAGSWPAPLFTHHDIPRRLPEWSSLKDHLWLPPYGFSWNESSQWFFVTKRDATEILNFWPQLLLENKEVYYSINKQTPSCSINIPRLVVFTWSSKLPFVQMWGFLGNVQFQPCLVTDSMT